MRVRRYRVFAVALIGWLGLLGVASPVALAGGRADEAPAIAPFTTAHLRLSGTITAQGQELPVQGEGEIDATRGASHLTIGLLGATFETIIVDGRTYSRNALNGRWEYTDGPQANGFNLARLAPYDPATIRAAGSNFTRLGAESVNGVPTTHWRADADLARLLGLEPGAGAGFTTSAVKMDLWIGASDNRLRQLAIDAQGTTTDASGVAAPFKQTLTLTFDHLDEPIAILAPPGAVLAATPVATPGGTLGGRPVAQATTGTTARPTATAPPVSPRPVPTTASAASTVLVMRVVAGSTIVLLAVAGVVAARQRQARGS